jgi:hypothetical protein
MCGIRFKVCAGELASQKSVYGMVWCGITLQRTAAIHNCVKKFKLCDHLISTETTEVQGNRDAAQQPG